MADGSLAQLERSGIYEIVNTLNGKRYIGSAACFRKRWKIHVLHLERGTHHSKHLQASWVKHGKDAFKFNILIECARVNLILYEQIAFDALRPQFNVALVAGSCLGVRRSDATRAKLSASKLGNTHTRGYKHRPESIAKLSESKKGNTHTRGKKRSAEAVAKTAAAHRGMKRSPETRAKIAAKALGRKRSAESIERGAAKLRGRPASPESVAHLVGNKHAAGRSQTAEERAMRSEKLKAAWAAKKAAGIPWR